MSLVWDSAVASDGVGTWESPPSAGGHGVEIAVVGGGIRAGPYGEVLWPRAASASSDAVISADFENAMLRIARSTTQIWRTVDKPTLVAAIRRTLKPTGITTAPLSIEGSHNKKSGRASFEARPQDSTIIEDYR